VIALERVMRGVGQASAIHSRRDRSGGAGYRRRRQRRTRGRRHDGRRRRRRHSRRWRWRRDNWRWRRGRCRRARVDRCDRHRRPASGVRVPDGNSRGDDYDCAHGSGRRGRPGHRLPSPGASTRDRLLKSADRRRDRRDRSAWQIVHRGSSILASKMARPSLSDRLIVPTGRCSAAATSATERSA
jgi:hypothetical protein